MVLEMWGIPFATCLIAFTTLQLSLQISRVSTGIPVFTSRQKNSFPAQTRAYAESILDWDFSAVMHREERGAGSFCKLLPTSLLTRNSRWSHILQNLVMKENHSYLQVTSWAKGEKADLCKAKSRDRLGGECRGKKQDPAGWGWEYSGKCPCVDSRAMYFLMSVRKRKY